MMTVFENDTMNKNEKQSLTTMLLICRDWDPYSEWYLEIELGLDFRVKQ